VDVLIHVELYVVWMLCLSCPVTEILSLQDTDGCSKSNRIYSSVGSMLDIYYKSLHLVLVV
jgi:hypothetical protein